MGDDKRTSPRIQSSKLAGSTPPFAVRRHIRPAARLLFADGAFDLVCLFEVIEHLDDVHALLPELARVLLPGGPLFLACPMNPPYGTYYARVIGHVRRYPAGDLEQK